MLSGTFVSLSIVKEVSEFILKRLINKSPIVRQKLEENDNGGSGRAKGETAREPESAVAINVDLRTAQIFKLSSVQSVCLTEGSDSTEENHKRRDRELHSYWSHALLKQWMTDAGTSEVPLSHKTVTEPKIIVQTRSEVGLLDDGYRWRSMDKRWSKAILIQGEDEKMPDDWRNPSVQFPRNFINKLQSITLTKEEGEVIKVWGLPFDLLLEEVGREIDSGLGEVLEVDLKAFSSDQARFIRVRVDLPLDKPLRRGGVVANPEGDKVCIGFKYERLVGLCYQCGWTGHEFKDGSVQRHQK
nr:putative wrky transcription factor 58 [Quercus suber]